LKKKLGVNSKNTVLFKFLRQIGKCTPQTASLKKKGEKKRSLALQIKFSKKNCPILSKGPGGDILLFLTGQLRGPISWTNLNFFRICASFALFKRESLAIFGIFSVSIIALRNAEKLCDKWL
jgi:hypothetical protein